MTEEQVVTAAEPKPVPFEYSIELLGENELTFTVWERRTTPAGHKALTPVKYPIRCSVCLDPATKKELFSADPNYKRPLCDKHAADKPDLNVSDRTKLTALQEQRLRKSQPMFTLHKVTGVPMVAELHRMAQRELHPHACMPKPPKKGHMPKREQAVKSAMLRTFRRLIAPVLVQGRGHVESLGLPWQGIPIEVLGKVGARAGELAIYWCRKQARLRRQRRSKAQQFSRRVNAGLMPGNTNRRRFGC